MTVTPLQTYLCLRIFCFFWRARPKRHASLSPFSESVEVSHSTGRHGDFALALTRCSCSALREVAVFVRECGKCKPLYAVEVSHSTGRHGDFALALTRCSCSSLHEVAVFVRECGKCKPLYASVIERCVTLLVSTWSVAHEQSFRFDGGQVHNREVR